MAMQYTAQVHDGHRTMEQTTHLLALAAKRAWDAWHQQREGGPPVLLDDAMRALWGALKETDVFMAGVAHARSTT